MKLQISREQFAAKLGCTVDQVKALSASNAIELGEMAAQAEQTGRKVNGYTAEQLRQHEARARTRSL